MAISYVNSATGVTSATLTGLTQADDIMIGFSFRDGNSTAPTIPAGWTSISSSAGTLNNGSSIAWKKATGATEVSGTWTSATSLIVAIYRGVNVTSPIGNTAEGEGSGSSTVTYPALTCNASNNTSTVLAFMGHRSPDVNLNVAAFTGTAYTNRSFVQDSTDTAAGHDIAAVNSVSSTTQTLTGTNGAFRARVIELLIGNQTVSPNGIASTVAFGSPTVSPGSVTVAPTALASTLTFGSPTLSIYVSPTAISSSLAFGSPTVAPGSVSISPTGISSGAAFGSPTVTPGDVTVAPTGIASSLAFGSPTTSIYVSPNGISSTLAFGAPDVSAGASILPTGLASSLAFGVPEISIYVSPTGIGSTLSFGTPDVSASSVDQTVEPNGIASTLAFGAPSVSIYIAPNGIPSTVTFGSPTVSPGAVTIDPNGIVSTLAFGLPIVSAGPVTISPNGIGSTLTFGLPVVSRGAATVAPNGVGSTLAFGVPTIVPGSTNVFPTGILSTLAFGVPSVLNGTLVPVDSIRSTLRFGSPTITYIVKPSGLGTVKYKQRINNNLLGLTLRENYLHEEIHEILEKVLSHIQIRSTEDALPRKIVILQLGNTIPFYGIYGMHETGNGTLLGLVKLTDSGMSYVSPEIPSEIRILRGDGEAELIPPTGWEIVRDASIQTRYNVGESPTWKAAAIAYVGV